MVHLVLQILYVLILIKNINCHSWVLQVSEDLTLEKCALEETLDTVKENAERQIEEYERENIQLQQTVETLRQRNEQTVDIKVKDIERENRVLHETVIELKKEVSKLQYDGKQMRKSYDTIKSSLQNMEQEQGKVNSENAKLNATLNLTIEKYERVEQELLEQEVENRKLTENVKIIRNELCETDGATQQNILLRGEVQQLKKALDNQRNSTNKTIDLERERDTLNRQIVSLKKTTERLKSEKLNQRDLERNLQELDSQNRRLQRNLEKATEKVEMTEQENKDLEMQVRWREFFTSSQIEKMPIICVKFIFE